MRDATNSSASFHIWADHIVYTMAVNGTFNVLNMCILDLDSLLAICYWLRIRSKAKTLKTNERMSKKKNED